MPSEQPKGLQSQLLKCNRATRQWVTELAQENANLRAALEDCMQYVDCDNSTMQTKYRAWKAVLDGKPWTHSGFC